ncbi:MAG: UDP-N-acetylglucosamine 1-carboxyvinyltransferase [Candidatus Cloacimonadota bacterium]|nr:MAG: UDP-N-acetylglucosamine 1-carboxyvinyltransferase [Candidatus Cloacimonadota bacterium]
MEKFIIKGGIPLRGNVKISGAKNAALPIIAASLLTEEPVTLRRIPKVSDVFTMLNVLKTLGCKSYWKDDALTLDASNIISTEAPYELIKKMRASYYVLGPLVARFNEAKVALPGGCALGSRPVDLHIKGLKTLGAKVEIKHGYVTCKAKNLEGKRIMLKGQHGTSVGATINVMMAASLSKGVTKIEEAAMEPEVVDVANFLNRCGGKIEGMGTPIIEIEGRKKLKGTEYSIIPDRIETGTLLIASAITKGNVIVKKCNPEHNRVLIHLLKEYGVEIQEGKDYLNICPPKTVKPLSIQVGPYPSFSTDLQPPMISLLSVTPGNSTIVETIFENRFMHVPELIRLGADINMIDRYTAVIKGVKQLSGAPLMASDIRASAALILAGLVAKGETHISRIYHTDRGYEHIEKKLTRLGARIERVSDPDAP